MEINQNRSVATDHREETVLRQRRPCAWLSAWVWMILVLLALPARAVLLQGQVELLPGLNLVGLPLDPIQTPTVSSLLLRLGDSTTIATVWRLDPTSGLLQRCGYDAGGQPTGEGCAASVSPGEGWLVEAHQTTTLPYTVNQPCPGVTLQAGLNLVAFPCATAVTSYTLLPLLGDAVVLASVQGLDPATGRWRTTTYYENQPAGPEFPILPGQAYLVSARSVSTLADADFDGLLTTQETDLGTDPANPDSDGDGLPDGAEVTLYHTNPLNADSDGDTFKDGEEVAAHTDPKNNTDTPAGRIPPDPATVAPAIDRTVATTTYAVTEFLYTGSNPIQTGVAPGAIEPQRAALVRGKVLAVDGTPLPGVKITILGHPELGSTLSRADGLFDLAVNGGGDLVLSYARNGYLPAQRHLEVSWQDYAWLPDVVLKPRDAQVTAVALSDGAPMQVARGSVITDGDGTRRATVLFPSGTQAQVILPDGSTQPVDTLHVRMTEYTVGAQGPQAMPAELPPTSGYTYAVELSTDEAVAKVNGRDVLFSQPIIFYLENFLNLPVGIIAPVGYYDSNQGAWVPSEDGRIIKILSIVNGAAVLDIDGSGKPADDTALAALGITNVERTQLATLYAPGQSLWRARMSHFSTWDVNFGWGPDPAVPPPENPPPQSNGSEPLTCEEQGSIIECQNQVLGERVAIAGTPFTLNYRSNRVPGNAVTRTLTIPLSGETVHPTLTHIVLEVRVAGQIIKQSFPPQTHLSTTVTWDGKDAYGRPMQGAVQADVSIGYVYAGSYYNATMRAAVGRSFGQWQGTRIGASIGRLPWTFWQDYQVCTWDARPTTLAGWSLDVHHAYDAAGGVLYGGDGQQQRGVAQRENIRLSGILRGCVFSKNKYLE